MKNVIDINFENSTYLLQEISPMVALHDQAGTLRTASLTAKKWSIEATVTIV
jgi:hypothetical protein